MPPRPHLLQFDVSVRGQTPPHPAAATERKEETAPMIASVTEFLASPAGPVIISLSDFYAVISISA